MVKARMNSADVAAEVKCLRRLIGMRCTNVYDLSPKTYVFKLINSSGTSESGESEKVLLLMECGVRMHTTNYVRDKSNTPSGYTLKLRKHIRTKRLEDVRQVGYDRIVLFQFGLGANAHYVILELFSYGNIVLTDSDFIVMTLLQSHRDNDKRLEVTSGNHYPLDMCRIFERTTSVKVQDALASIMERKNKKDVERTEIGDTVSDVHEATENQESSKSYSRKAKTGGSYKLTLKFALGQAMGYGPGILQHIIMDAGLAPNLKLTRDFQSDNNALQALIKAIDKFEDWLEDVMKGDNIPKGYILMKKVRGKDTSTSGTQNSDQIYNDFCPLLLSQFKLRDSVKFETFDAALDEFYSYIDSQKSGRQEKAIERSVVKKLDKIRTDQENRAHILKTEVDYSVKTAELIEYNLKDVDAAILAVHVALANGKTWEDVAHMVKEEKKSGNPVAGIIDKLNLEKNCMTLLLSNNLDEMDDDEKTQPADKVEVDLALSAYANARRWYEMKKKQESKQEKTIAAQEMAMKAAEKKTRLLFSKEKNVAAITHMRKVHWFEKFNWFISSENYLVISGRNAEQNEIIVKRYMSKGDLYVHAELHAASSTIIKNHKPENPVPPLTLNQAGCFTVCYSRAWDSKIVTSAWWVYPHQVSKTGPTGETLAVGTFMIQGKKNFLPPHPLIMGFGMLFCLDESSLGSHVNERRIRCEEGIYGKEGIEHLLELSDCESEDKFSEKKHDLPSGTTTELTGEEATLEALSTQIGPDNSLDSTNVTTKNKIKSSVKAGTSLYDKHTGSNTSWTTSASVTSQPDDLVDRALELGPTSVNVRDCGFKGSQEESEELNLDHVDIAKREKPYVSKAERRKQKKGQKSDSVNGYLDHGKKEYAKTNGDIKRQSEKLNVGGGKLNRGQKGKLKKMKEKYADQDEEERITQMSLLADQRISYDVLEHHASAGKVQDNVMEPKIQAAVAVAKPVAGPEETTKICYKCKKAGHLSRDCQEQSNGTKGEEGNIHEVADEEKDKSDEVDYLTGNPLPDDDLLYAVPVCGPYNALQSYKYRVKISPGAAKRGKAAKMSMDLFSQIPEATQREKELMTACTESELVAAIIGNVKVSATGLNHLKQKEKKEKKATRQQS